MLTRKNSHGLQVGRIALLQRDSNRLNHPISNLLPSLIATHHSATYRAPIPTLPLNLIARTRLDRRRHGREKDLGRLSDNGRNKGSADEKSFGEKHSVGRKAWCESLPFQRQIEIDGNRIGIKKSFGRRKMEETGAFKRA